MNNNSSIIDNIPQLPQPISNDIINAMNNLWNKNNHIIIPDI
jgi:hypothetical protein